MGYWKKDNKETEQENKMVKETIKDVLEYPIAVMPERKITKETCKKFGVRMAISEQDGKTPVAYYFPYYDSKGKLSGYKKRDLTLDKHEKYHFTTIGKVGVDCKLFGQTVAESIEQKRKNLVYVEGELDQLSTYQAMKEQVKGTKWEAMEPFVVSISCGTANAVEATLHNEGFIRSFDSLSLMFDNDSSTDAEKKKNIVRGKEATEAVASALVGTGITLCTIELPNQYKDASDMLVAGEGDSLAKIVQFGKKAYTAEKIVRASDINFEDLIAPQPEGIYVDCFPELNRKIHGFRTRELVVLTSPSNVGKCHGKGQEILMADLSTKKVEDIVVGDKVMGATGQARTVLSLHKGVDDIYKVTPKKGLPYTVNSKHLLVLQSNDNVPKRGLTKNGTLTMSAKEFHDLPKHYREHVLSGVRATLTEFGSGYNKEAYILGLWLAEGTSSKPQFCLANKDKELHEILLEYAKEQGYRVNISPTNLRETTTAYDLAGGMLVKLRDKWGVLENKHIPKEFMNADYQTRLELLAGFLDGDGYLTSGGFELTLKKNQLVKDIVKLAMTLGLSVTYKDKFCKCQNFDGDWYTRIHIFGGADKIPNKLLRKKAANKPIRNQNRVGLDIELVGKGEYYGFEVDGDHLYCLPDMQITHNSTVCAMFANTFIAAGERVGMIFLEETNKQTLQRAVASKLKVNYNKFKNDPLACATKEKIKQAYDEIANDDKLIMLGHFGSLPISELMNKIRHMHLVEGCSYIVLDHLSVVISGSHIENERKELDIVMTELAAFCAANDVCIIAVSHINRSAAEQFKPPKGKEDEPFWVTISKEQMRGSAALEQLAFIVLGLEPQIMPDRSRGNVRLTVLKNRPWGILGVADEFSIDEDTWEVKLANKEYGKEFS